jgi:hypothetical protein
VGRQIFLTDRIGHTPKVSTAGLARQKEKKNPPGRVGRFEILGELQKDWPARVNPRAHRRGT